MEQATEKARVQPKDKPRDQPKMEAPHHRACLVSSCPGRVRVRLIRGIRDPGFAERIREHLIGQSGVESTEVNSRTGSVTVQYDRGSLEQNRILGFLRDLDVLVEPIAAPPSIDEIGVSRTRSTFASDISQAADSLDRQIALLTGRKLDLRVLFPAGLFALALRQVWVEGLGLTQVPGYVLLWYAFDSFWKLHRELPDVSRRAEPSPSSGPSETGPGASGSAVGTVRG